MGSACCASAPVWLPLPHFGRTALRNVSRWGSMESRPRHHHHLSPVSRRGFFLYRQADAAITAHAYACFCPPASSHRAFQLKPLNRPRGQCGLHEIKHDGFHIIARKNGSRVRLYSRLRTWRIHLMRRLLRPPIRRGTFY
jgi:hypothetical protein